MVSILLLISSSSSLFSLPLRNVQSAPTTIGITVIHMSHSFFSSRARSKSFHLLFKFFTLTLSGGISLVVWVTASSLNFKKVFWAFWSISAMLLGRSRFFLWSLIAPIPFQAFRDRSKPTTSNWYHRHLHVPRLYLVRRQNPNLFTNQFFFYTNVGLIVNFFRFLCITSLFLEMISHFLFQCFGTVPSYYLHYRRFIIIIVGFQLSRTLLSILADLNNAVV